jgi:large subunit ribosomal protein L24
MAEKFKIKRGDRVVVLAGRDKGKKGEVMRVVRQDRRAVVSGVNMIKRHTRPSTGDPGGIIQREAPLHISNLALEDPKDGRPTRVGFRFLDDGRKVRYAKRSGEVIDL